jgi:hypothetical protein
MTDQPPKIKYNDYPFEDIVREAAKLIEEKKANVHQKFTCDSCGSRQTMDEPNKFFTSGICEECGHVTDIVEKGCNYLAHFRMGGEK